MMKKIERSFFSTTIRLFKPIFACPFVTLRSFLLYSLWGIGPIIHIFFIKNIVGYIELGEKEGFIGLMIYYGIFNILYELLEFLFKKWGWVESINAYRKVIHNEYIKKFISLDNNLVEKLGTGRLISLIDKGMDTWSLGLDDFIKNFIIISMTFIFTFYMILSVDFLYGILFLSIYIVLHIIGGILNKYTLYFRRQREDNGHLYVKQLIMIMMNKFEILQSAQVEYEIKNLDTTSDKLYHCNLKMVPYIHSFFRLPEGFMVWTKFLIMFFIGLSILKGESSLSVLVGLFGILTLMDSVIERSMVFFKDFTKNFTSIEKLWDFFDDTPSISGYTQGKKFKYKGGQIELTNIFYGYNEGSNIFEDFNLKIEGEKVLAFVGNSGGGKTTLAKLISGYIQPNKGKITIDKQSIEDISLISYYKEIGYLTQEPSVFDGTIFDNLTYAIDKNITKEKLKEIITLSKCEFIYDLPEGLETEIGERGVKLSGGQKQRLAIAKIFLKDPKIIILDEPTSALDSFSEEQITKAMKNLFKERTVIIIAHRLQTVKHADRIIVIEGGKIVEDGNHESLIKQGGTYAKMLELQSGF